MSNSFAAIIQARMGSTRSSGKVLTPLAGVPMLKHIIWRLQRLDTIDQIILAIPETPQDEPLYQWALENSIKVTKGPEEDVLLRFILAAEQFGADQILRICADSPLFDAEFMNNLAKRHLEEKADFSTISEEVPIGTVFPAVSLKALKFIADQSSENRYREHVTTYIEDYPQHFVMQRLSVPNYLKDKSFRLTVDVKADIELMKIIYDRYFNASDPVIDLQQVISFLENNPETAKINAHVKQNNWRKD
jgi:spore coat polysaccharide biosynthesis protein SpsF